METHHKLLIKDSSDISEIKNNSIQLIITSPPYFNAPNDYKNMYKSYGHYLKKMKKIAKQLYRVLDEGRIAAINVDDILINGEKFPLNADFTNIFLSVGFKYRDKITWKKPDGFIRISHRSGLVHQNPYPMYFYPDNQTETILIFQKGKFNYKNRRIDEKENSKIDIDEFTNEKWYKNFWEITNVSPKSQFEKNIAAFPENIPYRLIKLYSYKGENVLDPFVGSGTTMKIARQLGRNSIGIEIKKELALTIEEKLSFDERLQVIE